MRRKLGFPSATRNEIVAEHVYHQPGGTPHLLVQRTVDKRFLQSHWTDERWVFGKPNGPKIPYLLPALVNAPKDKPVFIVEGEKDADRLNAIGLVATTDSGGAGKWTADLNRWFERRTVYIIADNDDAGRKHAQKVARNLSMVAESLRVVQLDGLPQKGDVSDWLQSHRTRSAELLLEISARAPVWSEPASGNEPSIDDLITEDTVAQRFAERHQNQLRYCHDNACWFRWTRNRWAREKTGLASNSARVLVRELSRTEPVRVRHIASKSSFARAVERYAINDPAFAVTAANWDADTFLLGTPDGAVDLRSGCLRAADPNENITKSTSVTPAEKADCPRWRTFLSEATGGDIESIQFLQRWCGYALTGDTREHALVFMYGPGGNGKGVFLNTVVKIFGDYATTAPMDTFTASKFDRHPTELAMLHGARLATASETEEGRAWAESRIKQLTGGDLISARFLYRDHFTYKPQFKLFLVGNHKPQLRNVDDAARRRFHIVPFVRKPARPDTQLESKLNAEAAGILRWMIDGCLEWQKKGLLASTTVRHATEAYFVDQDLIGQWLREKCDVDPANTTKRETTATLYASWKVFADLAGERIGSMKSFSEQLVRKGFTPYRTSSERGYTGIRLGRKTFRLLPAPIRSRS